VTESTVDKKSLVEEVVDAVTRGAGDQGSGGSSLQELILRAKQEFDENTLESFARALVGHLAHDSANLPVLEALVIVGLAHPKAAAKHRINLTQEGRRLAHLFEEAGQTQRAQSLLEILAAQAPDDRSLDQELASMMRRTGNADLLVERYLSRASELVASARPLEAIPWLREALLIDRTRRDVARMIRDLRYQAEGKSKRMGRRIRRAIMTLIVLGAIGGLVARELRIREDYKQLSSVAPGDLSAMNARVSAIDAFQGRHRFWTGMFDASKERRELRVEIMRIEATAASAERENKANLATRIAQAQAARLRGRQYAGQGDFSKALTELRSALEGAPASWEERARVEADIQAIIIHLAGESGTNNLGSHQ
jgi:tetratricopeptide (TPR) repeat protein